MDRLPCHGDYDEMSPSSVFWTGGFDSSFRVLQLLSNSKSVQPFYLLDCCRKSTINELKAMQGIRNLIREDHPDWHDRLLPTQYLDAYSLLPDARLSALFSRIRAKAFLGSQYLDLALARKQFALDSIELSVKKSDRLLSSVLNGSFGDDPRSKDQDLVTDILLFFEGFSLPLINQTKLQLAKTSVEQGFGTYLEMTWFCHTPTRSGQPCGICGPCQYAVEDGFGYRLGLTATLNNRLLRIWKLLRVQ
jgi:hypothetical protein